MRFKVSLLFMTFAAPVSFAGISTPAGACQPPLCPAETGRWTEARLANPSVIPADGVLVEAEAQAADEVERAAGGHGEAPDCSDHTDPGAGWNWTHYLDLVRTGGAPMNQRYKFSLGGNTGGDDLLYDQEVAIVAKDRKCSTSYIQRKLAIG